MIHDCGFNFSAFTGLNQSVQVSPIFLNDLLYSDLFFKE
jgi:hypothetical protein